MFQFTFNYLCTFKNSARIFLIIFIQLFFSSAIHLHNVVRVAPLCPSQRVVCYYIDCVSGAAPRRH